MGLRYYAWPLRDRDELAFALRDPAECIATLDPGLNEDPGSRIRPVPDEDCVGIDKAWGPLQDFLLSTCVVDDSRFRIPIGEPGYEPGRPAMLVLDGGAGYRDMRWDEDNPFVAAVTPDELRDAVEDLRSIDPAEIHRFYADDPGNGAYCADYLVRLREAMARWVGEGWGCVYLIGTGGIPPWTQTVRWSTPYTGRTAAEVHAEYEHYW